MVDSGVSVQCSFVSHFNYSVLERIILSVDLPMQKCHLQYLDCICQLFFC